MPNEAEIRLWTHGDDDEDDATVRAMIDALEDAGEPEEAEETLEDYKDTEYLYRVVSGHQDP